MKKLITICAVVMMILVAGAASADTTLLTQPGDNFTITGGYPWVQPATNYHYIITTNGTDGKEGTNAGDGLLDGINLENLNISTWRNFAQYPEVKISGTIAAGGLSGLDDASADQTNWTRGSWLTIGLISKNQALRAADWYLSGMFNNSVMVGFQNWGGQYSAFAEDTAGDGSTQVLVFDPTKALSYELTINNTTKIASLQIDNGSGWSSSVSHSFGLDNWGWGGIYNDDLSQAAFIVQAYGFDNSGTTSVTFGDVTVTPEPATVCLLGLGALSLIRRKK